MPREMTWEGYFEVNVSVALTSFIVTESGSSVNSPFADAFRVKLYLPDVDVLGTSPATLRLAVSPAPRVTEFIFSPWLFFTDRLQLLGAMTSRLKVSVW